MHRVDPLTPPGARTPCDALRGYGPGCRLSEEAGIKSLGWILSVLGRPFKRRDTRLFVWMCVALVVMVGIYSALFHEIMDYEGQRYSWPTAVYWTIVTMSTLGFGDITFTSDLGRLFSVVVLVTGATFILVLIPFAFIQFVFLPWMEARAAARAPRQLGDNVRGHIVLTEFGAVSSALVERAERADVPYVLLAPDLPDALRMVDEGRSVMIGDLDDPDTYRRARVDEAALVVATRSDTSNTNVAFTVREISPTVPIAATASSSASVDILELAGCDLVLHLGQLLGAAMARRVLGNDHCAHEIGSFDELVVAEATAAGTPFVGSSLMEIDLRGRFGVSVAGFLRRGNLELASPERVIGNDDVLVLVGSSDQLDAYDSEIGTPSPPDAGVVIIGGGRVGRAAAQRLEAAGLHCRIVEQKEELIPPADDRYVQGDAAELEVLEEAGLSEASAVLITTHDDDINIYLTIYCRRLRPELQIIPRANLDRNVATLHRAGADSVLSYASIGATTIWNAMSRNDTVVLAEGLEVFRVPCPTSLAGSTLADAEVRSRTGCSVVAIATDGSMVTNPDPRRPLPGAGELVLIGDSASQSTFLEAFPVSARAGD